MRKLATVAIISAVKPIEGADKICAYKVRNWWVVDGKGKYNVGQKVVYYEIDSLLPIKNEFEFLRTSSYKKLSDNTEGFRLRTIKLRGQISQGLITNLPDFVSEASVEDGDDLTEQLGVTKYEPPIPFSMSGNVKGNFPSFVPKTDEERIQNIAEREFNSWKNVPAYITEKIDGSSVTVYYNNGNFGVCSRNQELALNENNSFVSAVLELDLENKLRNLGKNIALQGELHGFGVQGNHYKKSSRGIAFFTAFDIDSYSRIGYDDFIKITSDLNLTTVPVLNDNFNILDTHSIDDLISMADGESALNKDVKREGIVIRGKNGEFSVKCISNAWLIKTNN